MMKQTQRKHRYWNSGAMGQRYYQLKHDETDQTDFVVSSCVLKFFQFNNYIVECATIFACKYRQYLLEVSFVKISM